MNLRTWAEVDLQRLKSNVTVLLAFTKAKTMVIVKANAYGHGATEIATAAISGGAHSVGVGDPEEALELRRMNFRGPILLLGHTPASYLQPLIDAQVAFTFWTKEQLNAASLAAKTLGQVASLHLYVDLDMGRFGCIPDDANSLLTHAADLPSISVDGLMSHLPSIDEDLVLTSEQIQRFGSLARNVSQILPRLTTHLLSSAGLPLFREAYFDMVRAGIVTYGVSDAAESIPGIMPVLEWKASVLDVRSFSTGATIGYGAEYACSDDETIAVIGVGYADGFRRVPKAVNSVLFAGEELPVVGRVATQHSFVRVPKHLNLAEGDAVTVMGKSQEASISAKDLARRWRTNEWDVLVTIGPSVKRVYIPAGLDLS